MSFNKNLPSFNLVSPEFNIHYTQIDTSNFVKLLESSIKVDQKYNFNKTLEKINSSIRKLTKGKNHDQ